MPVTPYHFGINGTIAFVFKRYLDVPLMILANVAVDVEVPLLHFLKVAGQHHRFTHTLLLGGLYGVLIGIAAFYLWPRLSNMWKILRLPYHTSLWKLIASAVLGCWLHVIVDSIYHWEIEIFWPLKGRPFYGLMTGEKLKVVCLFFWLIFIVLYLHSFVRKGLQNEKTS